MVVWEFSCVFNVVVGGSEYCVYLCQHLDQKLKTIFFNMIQAISGLGTTFHLHLSSPSLYSCSI